MLYDCFRVAVMITSALGIIHMVAMDSFIYIYFPVVALVWGLFSFFDEDDKEYIRRNGYYSDYRTTSYYDSPYAPPPSHNTRYGGTTNNRTQYTSYYQSYNSKEYDGLVKKCKRNFNITIAKDGEI